MGFVRIEMVINANKKFSFEIETEDIYKMNGFSEVGIESCDRILEICIANEIIIIRTEDRDFRNGFQAVPFIKNNRRVNNINAYDWQGTHLWNIGDLVGDIKMPFNSVTHIPPMDVEKEFDIKLHCHSSNLFKCISGGFTFIIDASTKELLLKVAGKTK